MIRHSGTSNEEKEITTIFFSIVLTAFIQIT